MASLRKLCTVASPARLCLRRSLSTQTTKGGNSARRVAALGVGGATAAVAGCATYWNWDRLAGSGDVTQMVMAAVRPAAVSAASGPQAQPSVFSQTKKHALYLWIHVKPQASAKEVAKVCAKLQQLVDTVVDPALRDEDDEVIAGVGFGPNFYAQVKGKAPKSFDYPHRKGANGEMPSTGGDVFIHAKSDEISKLFELCQLFLQSLPKDSVETFEDIYSFVYRNGRDLSGFIDGTENRADDEGRQAVAVEAGTGGSYVITQKWQHDLDVINTEKKKTLESWVGRDQTDSTEIYRKTVSSHVARMTSGHSFQAAKPVEIVRQSMPYGSLSGDHGLFFIGYASDPINFNFMLERMVGAGGDGHCDDIMKLTKNTKGTYWYFPGMADLAKMA